MDFYPSRGDGHFWHTGIIIATAIGRIRIGEDESSRVEYSAMNNIVVRCVPVPGVLFNVHNNKSINFYHISEARPVVVVVDCGEEYLENTKKWAVWSPQRAREERRVERLQVYIRGDFISCLVAAKLAHLKIIPFLKSSDFKFRIQYNFFTNPALKIPVKYAC